MVNWTSGGSGMELRSVSVPNQTILPGQPFEIQALFANHSSGFISDPDGCDNSGTPCTGQGFYNGYCVKAVASIEGGSQFQSNNMCATFNNVVPPHLHSVSMTATAPETEGQVAVSVTGVATGTGNQSDPITRQITVSSESTKRPSNGNGGSGGNGNGSGRSAGNLIRNLVNLAGQNPLGTAVVGGIAVAAVSQSVGQVAEE